VWTETKYYTVEQQQIALVEKSSSFSSINVLVIKYTNRTNHVMKMLEKYKRIITASVLITPIYKKVF
jgi:hypothetical protein